jgi:hypothetical protein
MSLMAVWTCSAEAAAEETTKRQDGKEKIGSCTMTSISHNILTLIYYYMLHTVVIRVVNCFAEVRVSYRKVVIVVLRPFNYFPLFVVV